MGNLCAFHQNKYNQLNETNQDNIKLEVFDINVAKQNTKTIKIDSKNIYEEYMNKLLPKFILRINNLIEKESSELKNDCVCYVHEDNCDLKSIDEQYRKREYDRFYINKLARDICDIYNKKGYKTYINGTHGFLCISWK